MKMLNMLEYTIYNNYSDCRQILGVDNEVLCLQIRLVEIKDNVDSVFLKLKSDY